MHARTLAAAAITAALVLLPTAAHAGSDSPTPYTVTAAGLTLPTGTTFEEQGHINYRVTALDGTGERTSTSTRPSRTTTSGRRRRTSVRATTRGPTTPRSPQHSLTGTASPGSR